MECQKNSDYPHVNKGDMKSTRAYQRLLFLYLGVRVLSLVFSGQKPLRIPRDIDVRDIKLCPIRLDRVDHKLEIII